MPRKYMRHALWELRYKFDPNKVIAVQKRENRRMAQSIMLNSLGIHSIYIHTPESIVARVQERFDGMKLEELLPDIAFPIDKTAREIAEEIQQIDADLQRALRGQKSIISDSTTIPEATDAFTVLTEKIVEDVRVTIDKEIEKQAKLGKNEAEIIEHVEKAIETYQNTTIPHKMEMLATHFNGKLSEEDNSAAGYKHYFWHTAEDEKVRPAHAENNGKIFAWDDPPPTGHPGEDYNCRCWVEPVDLSNDIITPISDLIDDINEDRPQEEIINDPKMEIVRQKAAMALELIKASDGSESTVRFVKVGSPDTPFQSKRCLKGTK